MELQSQRAKSQDMYGRALHASEKEDTSETCAWHAFERHLN